MPKTICVIDGHPDPADGHFVNALADAYVAGAQSGGHVVSRIEIGKLPLTFLSNAEAFASDPAPEIITERQKMAEADHVVMIYPLWMGTMPAALKAFIELAACGGFFLDTGGDSSAWPAQKMKGKSARLIVTMGMPSAAYRLIFGGHSVKGIEQGILKISGFSPVRHTILGGVEGSSASRAKMLAKIEALGRGGQ